MEGAGSDVGISWENGTGTGFPWGRGLSQLAANVELKVGCQFEPRIYCPPHVFSIPSARRVVLTQHPTPPGFKFGRTLNPHSRRQWWPVCTMALRPVE